VKNSLLLFFILLPCLVKAAEPGEHGPASLDPHTLRTLIYQFINVALLVVGLVYFLKDGVRQFFQDKQKEFLAAEEKAQAAKQAAQAEHLAIQIKLTKLESTADENLSRAQAEASDLRNQMLKDAQEISERIRHEAKIAALHEVEKARESLRHQMIVEAAKLTEQNMKEKVSSDDHRRLQGDFIQNIETVQS